MLSEMQVKTPVVPEVPKIVRVRFRKVGNLQFISHLDLQRTLQRILVRADIPLWYTKGFNPHMKIVFATPLSIGTESICEMVDIRLKEDILPEELAKKLNEQVTDELRILDAYIPTTKFSDIIWSQYEIKMHAPDLSNESVQVLKDSLSKEELSVTKKTKTGEKTINIIPLVRDFSAQFDQTKDELCIRALLRADGENYLNPELFISALRNFCGNGNDIFYTILRVENYLQDGETAFR